MDYIHGYSDTEQERLIQQAEYWREKLILKDLDYQAGEKLLEIGCGAGAVLGILGQTFPGLKLAGIDLEQKQINYVCPESSCSSGFKSCRSASRRCN
jgi:cyclopropane fatty-acyl-phospholipid synthase-like methyltransferase